MSVTNAQRRAMDFTWCIKYGMAIQEIQQRPRGTRVHARNPSTVPTSCTYSTASTPTSGSTIYCNGIDYHWPTPLHGKKCASTSRGGASRAKAQDTAVVLFNQCFLAPLRKLSVEEHSPVSTVAEHVRSGTVLYWESPAEGNDA